MQYPYFAPIILTDDIFQAYGGILGDTLPEARQASYRIAEMFVSEDIETLLLPTQLTGTYSYSPVLTLDHAYVSRVHLLRFYDVEEDLYWTISGTNNIYASLRNNGEYGIVDLHQVLGNCQGCWSTQGLLPYKIEAIYTAGLSSGQSFQSNVLLALTVASKIILNEIVGFGNEAPGDVGVQRYSNQGYSESRVGLLRTRYGTSAQANFIHNLLSDFRRYREVGL